MAYLIHTALGPLINLDDTARNFYAIEQTPYSNDLHKTMARMSGEGTTCDFCGSRITRFGADQLLEVDISSIEDHPLNLITQPYISLESQYTYDGESMLYYCYDFVRDAYRKTVSHAIDALANKRPIRRQFNQVGGFMCRGVSGGSRGGGRLTIEPNESRLVMVFNFDLRASTTMPSISNGSYVTMTTRQRQVVR